MPSNPPDLATHRQAFLRDIDRLKRHERLHIPGGWTATLPIGAGYPLEQLEEAPKLLLEFLQRELSSPTLRSVQLALSAGLQAVGASTGIDDFAAVCTFGMHPLVRWAAKSAEYRLSYSDTHRRQAARALRFCNQADLRRLDAGACVDVFLKEPNHSTQLQLASVLRELAPEALKSEAPRLEAWAEQLPPGLPAARKQTRDVVQEALSHLP